MDINKLKKIVYEENLNLVKNGLVVLTWGNVSMADRRLGVFVIKPSGVSYEKMKPEDMVVVSLKTGKKVSGKLNPSSDTPTHLELYRRFSKINGIAHTHSTFATAFAQAGMDIPALGTTHADTFYGDIPCADKLPKKALVNYEHNTAIAIHKTFELRNYDYLATPGIILQSHGPFTWGADAHEAVKNAITLEAVAKLAYLTLTIKPNVKKIDQYLSDKHYERKHGKNAYYGQK